MSNSAGSRANGNRNITLLSVVVMFILCQQLLTSNPTTASPSPQQVTEQQWKTYVDDDGEFTIEYPANYQVVEINKTETDDTHVNGVIFKNGSSVYVVYINKYDYETPEVESLQDYNYYLEKWWNSTSALTLSEGNHELVRPTEFNTYTLAGNQAASDIIKFPVEERTHVVLQVGRILNDGDLILTLGTKEQSFNQELPQMRTMIKSMNFTTDRYDW